MCLRDAAAKRRLLAIPLSAASPRSRALMSELPTTLSVTVRPFDLLFPDLARRDVLAIDVVGAENRPPITLLFRELYCTDPGCDCHRVILHAAIAGREHVIAGIGYGFEPSRPPFQDEPQIMLDPLNPQSELSDAVLDVFTKLVTSSPSVRERFIEHYVMFKNVVDDPSHPDHHKVRGNEHSDPGFSPAYKPRPQGFAPNQRCHCRSGKKFKNCCGRFPVAERE